MEYANDIYMLYANDGLARFVIGFEIVMCENITMLYTVYCFFFIYIPLCVSI